MDFIARMMQRTALESGLSPAKKEIKPKERQIPRSLSEALEEHMLERVAAVQQRKPIEGIGIENVFARMNIVVMRDGKVVGYRVYDISVVDLIEILRAVDTGTVCDKISLNDLVQEAAPASTIRVACLSVEYGSYTAAELSLYVRQATEAIRQLAEAGIPKVCSGTSALDALKELFDRSVQV